MDGFCIIFTPSDRSWVCTPVFIQGVTSLFGIQTLKSLCIYHKVPTGGSTELSANERTEQLLDCSDVPVEEAITLQRTEPGHSAVMWLGGSPLIEAMARLSASLSECWPPLEASPETFQSWTAIIDLV